MAKHRHLSGDDRQLPEGVAVNLGGAYWSVDGARWPSVRPGLPPHLVELLAPPIVVGVAPVTSATPRTGWPESGYPGRHHRRAPAG